MVLRSAKRRTLRSLAVKAPSLNTGWVKRLVVTIGTARPVSSRAARRRLRLVSRSWSSASNGITSSSWNVMPQAPSSARWWIDSTGSSGGRVASPNGSRACHPTVHRPKVNRSSGVGSRVIGVSLRCVVGHGRLEAAGAAGLTKRWSNTSSAAPTMAASRPSALGTRSISVTSWGGQVDAMALRTSVPASLSSCGRCPPRMIVSGWSSASRVPSPWPRAWPAVWTTRRGLRFGAVGPIEQLVE